MEYVIERFESLQDADEAEDAYYAALSPDERLDILLEIVARGNEGAGEAAEGFARVHRVTELERS